MKLILLSFLISTMGFCCSTFQLKSDQGPLIGKSFDWDKGHGFVVVNRRHLSKTAVNIFPDEKKSAVWPEKQGSKYGSITYNQHGIEFPLSGMNEKGLVVEILWLDESIVSEIDDRASINELQWIQYQLDNFATVSEMLTPIEGEKVMPFDKIRLRNVSAKVHYMVCDAVGECATIEFLNGKTVVHSGKTLPYKNLTNDTYQNSLNYLKNFVGFGGEKEINLKSMESLDRFSRVASLSKSANSVPGVFKILDSVKATGVPHSSVWNLAYEAANGKAHFRTTELTDIRTIDLKSLDFSCKNEPLMLDMEEKLSGDVTHRFTKFDAEKNSKMIRKSVPAILAGVLENYPNSVKCTD